MGKIYFISDLHLFHDRQFIFKPRGFDSVVDMNNTIAENWGRIITDEDDIYILGDLVLNDTNGGLDILRNLKGKIHIIRGNHDTDNRMQAYRTIPNVVEICDGRFLRYKDYHFFLTHFPCLTGNLEKESLKQMTLNIFGHTHSKDKFYEDRPYMYNVACDAQNCTPICIDDIIEQMIAKVEECKEKL